MRTLLKDFEKFSLIGKVKLIIFFPILMITAVADRLIDIGVIIFKFIRRRYKEVLTISMSMFLIAFIIWMFVYMEQTVPNYDGMTSHAAELYVYTNCHQMSNNFIVAEDGKVNGFVRADEENIDKILAVIARYDIKNEDKIIECLTEFRDGDYSGAIWLHNYCWAQLEGEVGYAIDLKNRYR